MVWLFQYLVYFFYYICADFAYFLLFSLEHTRDLYWVTLMSNQSRLLIYLIHLIHFELILDPWWSLILYSLIQWSGGPWSSFSRKPQLWTVLHLHHILRLNTCVVHGYSAYFDPKTPLTISSERWCGLLSYAFNKEVFRLRCILGDPGAVGRFQVRAEEPLGTLSYKTSSKHSRSGIWLVLEKIFMFFCPIRLKYALESSRVF